MKWFGLTHFRQSYMWREKGMFYNKRTVPYWCDIYTPYDGGHQVARRAPANNNWSFVTLMDVYDDEGNVIPFSRMGWDNPAA